MSFCIVCKDLFYNLSIEIVYRYIDSLYMRGVKLFDQQKCTHSRNMKYMKRCQELFDTIDCEEFKRYYNSHYDKETQQKFGLTSTQLNLYCQTYGITKTKERFKILSYRSRLEKYGNGTFRNVAKSKQTRLNRYGDENYNNSQSISNTYKNKSKDEFDSIATKRKRTCIDKYGYEASSQAPSVKEKTKQTNLERYGVEWFCMTPQCRNFSANESQVNIQFEKYLESKNISYQREYAIEKYSYDFKIGDYVIELNPFPYHNTTWNPFKDKRISELYHQRKSQVAFKHGYTCLHIFDWVRWDDVIKQIEDNVQIKYFEQPRRYILDINTATLTDMESDTTVVLFDDGAVYG